jgi:uncharacterized repeat protein (TIGR03943 family)
MKRETQNILLILLGGALVKLGVNGDFLRYVKPAQQPWVIIGGAVIALLGVVAIVHDLLAHKRKRQLRTGHHHPARSAWLLLAPVLTVFLIAPPALGADSVSRIPPRAPAVHASTGFSPLPPGAVVPLSLSEFVTRAGWDSSGTLNGRSISLSGFIVRSGGEVKLARMVISCCAADAFPVIVRLTEADMAGFAADTWVSVVGQVVPGTATRENRYMPDFTVAEIHQVAQPNDPYEY